MPHTRATVRYRHDATTPETVMPRVTVVIPAYNAEATLGETLESLFAQTFADFELIMVDDGSTDGTVRVAESVGDHRLRALSVPNGGVSRARNHGVAQARGEFVAFLDADDLWEPGKLEQQIAVFDAQPSAGLCVTGAIRVDGASRELAPIPVLDTDDPCRTLLLQSMAVGCISSGMVRKTLLESVGGFDPRFSQCADWDLWLRLSRAGGIAVVPEQLVRYRSSRGNMSSDIGLLERDTFAVLDAFYSTGAAAPYRDVRTRAYSNHWMICAGSYLHQRQFVDSLRCLYRGVTTSPSNVVRLLGMPRRWLSRVIAGAKAVA
jgi:glycosyltransferase involved in cell wall biosynthesis